MSATHLPGEQLGVTIHGTAQQVDLSLPEHAGFREYCVEFYGPEWDDWGADAPYARIDATRMFTFQMDPEEGSENG